MANRHNNLQDVYSIIEKGPISRIELISRIKAELPHITSYNKVFNSLINRNIICVSTEDILRRSGSFKLSLRLFLIYSAEKFLVRALLKD